jgi:hypothetical protein
MKITEIVLDERTFTRTDSFEVAAVPSEKCTGRDDCLELRLPSCPALHLFAVVDISERLDRPRVFYAESAATKSILFFGGERVYRVSCTGQIEWSLTLIRQVSDAEYWSMQIVDHSDRMYLIYEGGVLALDDAFTKLWHVTKLFNDELVSAEKQALRFCRDHDQQWFLRLMDGYSSLEGDLD